MSFQERAAAGSGASVFVLALLFVFLILAAQYESWSLPLGVLLGTPIAIFGAMLGLWLAGLMLPGYQNNVFAQIGLVMLIGMAAKNAILIIEFAKLKAEEGMSALDAALAAARDRFRPILMTAFSFILGVLPLLVASGAGAEARKVMGMTVFSGMLAATVIGVLIVPALYVFVERSGKKANDDEQTVPTGVRIVKSRLLAMFTVTMLAACAMGPDYQRPESDVPDGYTQPSTDGESIGNLAWWALFEDEQLVAIINIALEQNKDLAIAVARVEETRALLGFVRADQFPMLGVSAGAGRGNAIPGVGAVGSISDNYILAGDLSFEVDLWGKLRRSTEAARAELMASIEARNVIISTLIADVASIYLLLVDLDERVEVARRTLKTRVDALAIMQARFDRGTVPLIDVNQAQIERADSIGRMVRTGTRTPANGKPDECVAGTKSGSCRSGGGAE